MPHLKIMLKVFLLNLLKMRLCNIFLLHACAFQNKTWSWISVTRGHVCIRVTYITKVSVTRGCLRIRVTYITKVNLKFLALRQKLSSVYGLRISTIGEMVQRGWVSFFLWNWLLSSITIISQIKFLNFCIPYFSEIYYSLDSLKLFPMLLQKKGLSFLHP